MRFFRIRFILNSLNGYVRPFITKIGHLYKKKYWNSVYNSRSIIISYKIYTINYIKYITEC